MTFKVKKDIAVRKIMLLDIKTNPNIPPELYSLLRYELELAYQVGYEQKAHNRGDRRGIEIVQTNSKGELMQEFANLTIAAKKLKMARQYLRKMLDSGELDYRGHFWKFKKDYEEKAITTSEHPYTFL